MIKLTVFSMDGCSHCVQLKKHLEENEIEYKLFSANNEEDSFLIQKFGVQSYPTLFFLDQNNTIIDIQVGFNPQAQNMKEVIKGYEISNG